MPLDGEYEPSPEQWVRDQVAEYEASGGERANHVRGYPIVVVTSRGARSGKLRKNPVIRVEHGGEYLAVASKGGAPDHPAWYRNVLAHPVVDLQDGPEVVEMSVRELEGAERETWWERAVAAFPTYAEYQVRTDRTIPLLLLTPLAPPS